MSARSARAAHAGRRLPAARSLSPLLQGELDGLCGLYAIVNALRLLLGEMRPLSPTEAEALFGRGINLLEVHRQLAYAAIWGIRRSLWKRLIAKVSKEACEIAGVALRPRWPLRQTRQVSRAQLLATIEAAISWQQPVLVALSGAHNHYTVICGYSAERLTLFDSGHRRWLSRAQCGPRAGAERWRHQIGTRSVTVLEMQ